VSAEQAAASGAPAKRVFALTVLAQDSTVQDPNASDLTCRVLRAVVQIPAHLVDPGPRGPRFHVVDYDPITHRLTQPFLLDGTDLFAGMPDAALVQDRRFHAQNIYVIAARTLAAFEFALGRRVPWSFGSHQLYLVPHAFQEANAYYTDDDQALLFGDYPAATGAVFTCLSHDIVAHEMTHAVLDGLRHRYDAPGLPDQAAFHEGFADVVALLSVFSMREVVDALIAETPNKTLRRSDVTPERLHELSLMKMAEQLGDAVHATRGDGLRNSAKLEPTEAWKAIGDPEWEEPHRRGEVLVASMMRALIEIWTSRLEGLIQQDQLDRARAAEEGSKAATHLLSMAIRAIDYCPPIEFEFADFLDAMLLSDEEVAPDDEHGYRPALVRSFGAFGIHPRTWPATPSDVPADAYSYREFNYVALRSEPEEVFRFVWENSDVLDIPRDYYIHVEDVLPSVRIGPDGFVVSESVVDYVQELETTMGGLRRLAPEAFRPVKLSEDVPVKVWGGGTVIFDQFGRVKHHQRKRLRDWDRQAQRLQFLIRRGIKDRGGRYGFSTGASKGMRFALLHQPDDRAREAW
jgi:Thermolysin metallopeptidase, catalytic domain